MLHLTGSFETPNASKYLGQLCKHFAHKIEVTHRDSEGTCVFPMGNATLKADDNSLTVEFALENQDHIEMAKSVIDSHLERFAFREDFKHMNWE